MLTSTSSATSRTVKRQFPRNSFDMVEVEDHPGLRSSTVFILSSLKRLNHLYTTAFGSYSPRPRLSIRKNFCASEKNFTKFVAKFSHTHTHTRERAGTHACRHAHTSFFVVHLSHPVNSLCTYSLQRV